MSIFNRFKTVVALYAIVGLFLAVSDALFPDLKWFEIWLGSLLMKLVIFIALWVVAPFVYAQLDGKREVDQ